MNKTMIVGFALLVIVTGSACALGSAATGSTEGETPIADATEAPPMFPVSINQGLASLDSYRMTYTTDSYDSSSQTRSVVTFAVARDRESDSTYTRNETRTTVADIEDSAEDSQEQYSIGNQLCALSDGEAEFTTFSEPTRVLMDLMSQAIAFSPLIEDPVYVRDETVNGVPVRTYTFELRSVGAASDVEAAKAGGTYSIAVDGDYLVYYLLDLELREAAEGETEAPASTMHIEASLEQVNQPVEIMFPEECLAAQPAPE
jgi:hypothetical protein